MSGLEELKNLRAILTSSLDTIISTCEARATEFPSLFAPADPEVEFSPAGIRNSPELADALAVGVPAAAQLVARVREKRNALAQRGVRVPGAPVPSGEGNGVREGARAKARRGAGHARQGSNGTLRSKLKMSGGGFFG